MSKFLLSAPMDRSGERSRVLAFLLTAYLAGALCGSLMGLYLPPGGLRSALETWYPPSAGQSAFLTALWKSGQFFLLLAVLSTSWLGVVLVPAAAVLRGCLLSCSVSALYGTGGWKGLLCAFLISGIPGIVLVPAFFMTGSDAFFAARQLLPRYACVSADERTGVVLRVALAGLAVTLSAAYNTWLLPGLLAGVTGTA